MVSTVSLTLIRGVRGGYGSVGAHYRPLCLGRSDSGDADLPIKLKVI